MSSEEIPIKERRGVTDVKRVGERVSLAMPLELEEGAPPIYSQLTVYILTGLMVALLVWANIATTRQLSVAAGEIAPFGSVHPVSHIAGGIVAEVFVREGDTVEAGTPVVRLRSEPGGGDFEKFESRRANLESIVERLSAQIDMRQPDFGEFGSRWATLVEEQEAAFEISVSKHNANLEIISEEQAIVRSQLELAAANLNSKQEQEQLVSQLLEIQAELIEDGYTSKATFLDAKTSYSKAQAETNSAASHLDQTERSQTRLNSEYEAAILEYKNEATQQRANVVAELKELEQPLVALAYRDQGLTVRAPVSGTVKSVSVAGEFAVLSPGETIAEIVPAEDMLVAEVRINPEDIGHIFIGQSAEVMITTFDPNRYGKLDGKVSYLSSDSFVDERDGTRYFSGRIEFESATIGSGKYQSDITVGMVVSAEIITRKRSLMEYMLKPIVRSFDSSFSEQ